MRVSRSLRWPSTGPSDVGPTPQRLLGALALESLDADERAVRDLRPWRADAAVRTIEPEVVEVPDPATATSDPLLRAMENMAAFHREHEKYYSVAPREQAVVLQRHSRTLHALADTWAEAVPSGESHLSPYEGATDLNAAAALQLDGVLFMEGDEPPGEIAHLIRDLRALSEDDLAAGAWLDDAMRTSWDVVATLVDIPGLADLVGERHRIVANNWQAAAVIEVAGRLVDRAADVLDRIDFRPGSVRADLGGARASVGLLASAAELIDRAADLHSEFATLVHDNERRWRVFRARVSQLSGG